MYRLNDGIRISLQPIWHPYIGRIRTWRRDFEQALERVVRSAVARDILQALASGDGNPTFNDAASAELTAEWRRLEELPRPDNQHAYLEFIRPAFEAHALLLVTLSQTPSTIPSHHRASCVDPEN